MTTSETFAGQTQKKTSPASNLRRAELLLREAQLKVTQPRKSVLKVLLRKRGPLSIDEILKSLKRGECDRVTVYRSVSALEKAGILTQCRLGDSLARFEFSDGNPENHHHHVVCKKCRSVEHLDLCMSDRWKAVLDKKGYRDVSHSLEFFGLCPQCSAHSDAVAHSLNLRETPT